MKERIARSAPASAQASGRLDHPQLGQTKAYTTRNLHDILAGLADLTTHGEGAEVLPSRGIDILRPPGPEVTEGSPTEGLIAASAAKTNFDGG